MKLIVIIQARTGSTRLPQKMLKTFYGNKNLLEIILEKFENFEYPIILATSTSENDSKLVEIAGKHSIKAYRGSENDVLQRFIDAGGASDGQVVIRVCADNPFLSIDYIKLLIEAYQENPANYISFKNKYGTPTIKTHYGFFAELVELNSLKRVNELTNEAFYHEHVTNYIYENTQHFTIKLLPIPFKENENIRLTIDTIDDLQICQQLYNEIMIKFGNIKSENVVVYLLENKDYLQAMAKQIEKNRK